MSLFLAILDQLDTPFGIHHIFGQLWVVQRSIIILDVLNGVGLMAAALSMVIAMRVQIGKGGNYSKTIKNRPLS